MCLNIDVMRLVKLLVLVCLVAPISAQMNADAFASELRKEYGPSVHREVFKIPAGEMVVDFAANGHVCKIQLPPVGPVRGQPGVRSPQGLDDFLLNLVPIAMRGKELKSLVIQASRIAISTVEYERVSISESSEGARRTGVIVTFKNETCEPAITP